MESTRITFGVLEGYWSKRIEAKYSPFCSVISKREQPVVVIEKYPLVLAPVKVQEEQSNSIQKVRITARVEWCFFCEENFQWIFFFLERKCRSSRTSAGKRGARDVFSAASRARVSL